MKSTSNEIKKYNSYKILKYNNDKHKHNINNVNKLIENKSPVNKITNIKFDKPTNKQIKDSVLQDGNPSGTPIDKPLLPRLSSMNFNKINNKLPNSIPLSNFLNKKIDWVDILNIPIEKKNMKKKHIDTPRPYFLDIDED